MPLGVDSVFCVDDAAAASWTAGTVASPVAGQSQEVTQYQAGETCPSGTSRVSVQVGGAGTSYLVAYDTRVPPAEDLSMFFALGFALAFGGVRIISYATGIVIQLVRRSIS